MLPTWMIEDAERRRRERSRQESDARRPALEVPEPPPGWQPPGSSVPLPTPRRVVVIDLLGSR
jgi:hypothetical protein